MFSFSLISQNICWDKSFFVDKNCKVISLFVFNEYVHVLQAYIYIRLMSSL